jgi:diguanylate cyclase (GGDEF)-like protein
MRLIGIRLQVFLLSLIPAAVISIALLMVLTASKLNDITRSLNQRTEALVRSLAPACEYGVATGNREVLDRLLEMARREPDVLGVAVFSDQGEVLAASGSRQWRLPQKLRDGRVAGGMFNEQGREMYIGAIRRTQLPVDDTVSFDTLQPVAQPPPSPHLGWVAVDISRDGALRQQRAVILQSLFILLVGLGITALVSWRLGRQISQPILVLTRALNRIGQSKLGERVPEDGRGEFREMQQGVNAMANKLQAAHEQMQERIDQATARLAYQATHDSLTGLINRREFEFRLERAVHTCRENSREYALCYMDLDQFKIINDTCGHAAGDDLLRQLALTLLATLRDRDTLGRLGGDEFALLLENCPLEAALETAESLRKTVQNFRFHWEDRLFSVGVSIGIVVIDAESASAAALLSAADSACYMAKDRGRNQIHVYEARDVDVARRRGEMQWVSRIHAALEENRLRLYWQEITPLQTAPGTTGRHVELLLRMLDEQGREIRPMAFIPAAERYLIMPLLDIWVIDFLLQSFKGCMDSPGGLGKTLFAINLSGISLKDPGFRQGLLDKLAAHPGIGAHLCFEITETAAIGNLTVVNGFIQAVRQHHCQFALDDFGSGLSSFGYLKNLQVDFLKIDGSFVKNMANDALDRSMVESIHRIGARMGLRTIAEVVEDDATLALLREMGVDYAQGNFLHAPEPLEILCRQMHPETHDVSSSG